MSEFVKGIAFEVLVAPEVELDSSVCPPSRQPPSGPLNPLQRRSVTGARSRECAESARPVTDLLPPTAWTTIHSGGEQAHDRERPQQRVA